MESSRLPLTGRQARFIRNFAIAKFDPTRQKEIAIKSGYGEKSALAMTKKIFDKPGIKKHVQDTLQRCGYTIDILIKKNLELLNAQSAMFKGQPDNLAQIQALNIGLKLHDAFPSTKIDIHKQEDHIFLGPEDVDRIENVDEIVEGELVEEEPIEDLDAPL